MAVTAAENVQENATDTEKAHMRAFAENPGRGGQQITVKIGTAAAITVAHVTMGAGSTHSTIFYERARTDYKIVGVGNHVPDRKGKTVYSALWAGHKDKRVTVTVQ